MTTDQIAAAEKKLSELIEKYQEIEDTPIPNAIKDAIGENWELTIDVLQSGQVRLAYPEWERHRDRKRLIRFGDALDILEACESALVDKLCVDEGTYIFGRLQQYTSAFTWLAENWNNLGSIWHAITELWDSASAFFDDGLSALILHLTLALAIPEFTKVALEAVKTRDLFPAQMRKKALPQRDVVRRYRRKVARL